MSSGQMVSFLFNYIIHLYGHARPLSDSFIYLFSALGWKLAGLAGMYWIGYTILALNAILFFLLLKRVQSPSFALLAALFYCLYSADTSQAFLTHSFGLHPSLTLLLIAGHLYLSNKKAAAYLLALVILFSYETPYLVFLGIPLLKKSWDSRLVREMLLHTLVIGGMLVVVVALRSAVGEGRVVQLDLQEAVTTPLLHMIQGPFTVLKTFITRPRQAIQVRSTEVLAATGIAFLLFILILWRLPWTDRLDLRESWHNIWQRNWSQALPADSYRLVQLGLAGLVMLVCAYPLTFTVDATAVYARETRVHAAGVVGAAIGLAAFSALLLSIFNAQRIKLVFQVFLAAWLALLVGFGFVIQNDYRLGWQYEQRFWKELLPLIQDAKDKTVILIEPGLFQDVAQIGANTWNTPRVIAQLYDLPADWKNPPIAVRLIPGWDKLIVTPNGELLLNKATTYTPPSLYGVYQSTDVIFIENGPQGMLRHTAPLALGERVIKLKQVGPAIITSFATTPAYALLISNPRK